jgi:hypothetical protein
MAASTLSGTAIEMVRACVGEHRLHEAGLCLLQGAPAYIPPERRAIRWSLIIHREI